MFGSQQIIGGYLRVGREVKVSRRSRNKLLVYFRGRGVPMAEARQVWVNKFGEEGKDGIEFCFRPTKKVWAWLHEDWSLRIRGPTEDIIEAKKRILESLREALKPKRVEWIEEKEGVEYDRIWGEMKRKKRRDSIIAYIFGIISAIIGAFVALLLSKYLGG